jgi:RHS repeat-associated protein
MQRLPRQAESPTRGESRAPASPSATAPAAAPVRAGEGTSARSKLPAVALPKGGGAIRGIGEKFTANPVTGTGSLTVPVAVSPGRSDFGPQLSLSYDSGGGNGPFGFGWSLGLPQISRKTDKQLPRYDDAAESDVFILSGSEDLVPELERDAAGAWLLAGGRHVVIDEPRTVDGIAYMVRRYRPRIEGPFARIERWTNRKSGETHWRSITRDNVTTLYGKDNDSRIFDPADPDPEHPTRIFSWLICETRDDKGNAIVYEYRRDDGTGVDTTPAHERNRGGRDDPRRCVNRYIKRIRYGNRTPFLDGAANRPVFLTEAQIENAGCMFEVVFDYSEHDADLPTPDDLGEWSVRADPFSSYRAGFEVRTTRLCQRVLMFHHFPGEAGVGDDCLVRSTDFTYSHEHDPEDARNPVYTFLLAVSQFGYKRHGGGYIKRSLPPVEFDYSQPVLQSQVREVPSESLENLPVGLGSTYQWTDLHGEGIPGIVTEQGGAWFYKRNISPITAQSTDGVTRTEAAFAPVEMVAVRPNLALAGGQAQFMDLAGDGQPDLVVLGGHTPGLYEHDDEEGWQPFRAFTSRVNRDLRDANLKLVDLDGDGHADVLITEDDACVWHSSLAEAGFGPAQRVHHALDEEKGPRLVFADSTQSIHLADLSGDGLADLVRIRNGDVCYWPNLGYGRFGAKVTMDHAPHFDHPDQFDHARIRLADIDGTGTTDIIYLHRDGVRLYFNQSGNGWSESTWLAAFPRVDNLAAITTVDLLGNGTACIVWSSPLSGDARRPMRYVKLMGDEKPHLLVSVRNNIGAETHVHYASSIRFYLQDRYAGRPWITRLSFPVHVVDRVTTYDHIGRNRFVTRYAYHHGYFDGEEREFRGFGMVEQWDTESFAALEADGLLEQSENLDAASHVPPVLTRTWFHTGVHLGREHISDFFAGKGKGEGEYYREPALRGDDAHDPAARALLLPDTVLPNDVPTDEEAEACRALKGSMLRQETYVLDGGVKAEHPYTVIERNYTIERLQPRAHNRHSTFFVHPREVVTYHYERNPTDPRIAHILTLEADQYGNVLKEAAIGYGRRKTIRTADANGIATELPDPDLHDLDQEDQAKQTRTLVTYTEHRVTNAIDTADHHRAPLPCETGTYELTGYTPTGAAERFRIEDLVELDPGDPSGRRRTHVFEGEIDYADTPTTGRQRRPIERVRTLYRADDLTGLLPLGRVESRALPGESYQLAFTPRLLAQVFRRPLDVIRPPGAPPPESLLPDPAAVLPIEAVGGHAADRGGYVDLDGDGNWWIPSGRVFYSPGSGDGAAQELTHARTHFFLAHRHRDAFHTPALSTETFVTYDADDLLVVRTTDPLGNVVQARNDYRVLQPELVSDPNRNRMKVAFDVLGLVVGTAVMGKPEENLGDSLAGFEADLTQAQIDALHGVEDPRIPAPALLNGATTRIVYDIDRFQRTRQAHPDDPTRWLPGYTATLARETHVSDPLPPSGLRIQIAFSYSDGLGREIQKKIQAEPGPLVDKGPVVDPRWVGSGWTIFNNKGKPVRQYEPFFSQLPAKRHDFEFSAKVGVSPVLFYDPVERVVATLHPNHTYEKVVFDAWRQATWDVNDTVAADPRTDGDIAGYVAAYFREIAPQANDWKTWLAERNVDPANPPADAPGLDPERKAALRTLPHRDTPTVIHFDVLGRPFLTIADNGVDADGHERKYATRRILLDIEGNQREVIDAKGRVVMRYRYSIAGPASDAKEAATNRIHQASMEAGERWVLNDVTGKPIRAWDSRGFVRRKGYDPLRRLTALHVTEEGVERLAEETIYGEGPGDAANHRTRVYRVRDGAGVVTSVAYEFKGNLLESRRDLLPDYRQAADWRQHPAAMGGSFTTRSTFDALNRTCHVTSPDGSVSRRAYNEANLLETVEVNLRDAAVATPFVTDIDYDAKGQRVRIAYGNGAATRYTYDPLTFRLTRLTTTRPGKPDATASQLFQNATVVQDLRYTYDPAGNITRIEDVALRTVHYGNALVEPVAEYTYDALYRLTTASGREHIAQAAHGFSPPFGDRRDYPLVALRAQPNDLRALRPYAEQYEYDAVGNIETLRHTANGDGWTRYYGFLEPSLIDHGKMSNRLTRTTVGNGLVHAEVYAYADAQGRDVHGCMTAINDMTLVWDFEDQLQRADLGGGGAAFYVYDAGGQRVRKVWEKAPGLFEERIYLGAFEVFRRHDGAGVVALERETLHVMDDQQRIALVDTKTQDASQAPDPNPPSVIRYQLGNHLGSASVELAADGALISYEEYHPYGTTAFQGGRSAAEVRLKRYRYTSKERDEESGLYYHGARYYAPWLGRWVSYEPVPEHGTSNLFLYVDDNPTKSADPSGMKPQPPEIPKGWVRDPSTGFVYPKGRADLLQTLIEQKEYSQQVWRSFEERPRLVEGFRQGVVSAEGTVQAANVAMWIGIAALGGAILGGPLAGAAASTKLAGGKLAAAYAGLGIRIGANFPKLSAATISVLAALSETPGSRALPASRTWAGNAGVIETHVFEGRLLTRQILARIGRVLRRAGWKIRFDVNLERLYGPAARNIGAAADRRFKEILFETSRERTTLGTFLEEAQHAIDFARNIPGATTTVRGNELFHASVFARMAENPLFSRFLSAEQRNRLRMLAHYIWD